MDFPINLSPIYTSIPLKASFFSAAWWFIHNAHCWVKLSAPLCLFHNPIYSFCTYRYSTDTHKTHVIFPYMMCILMQCPPSDIKHFSIVYLYMFWNVISKISWTNTNLFELSLKSHLCMLWFCILQAYIYTQSDDHQPSKRLFSVPYTPAI